MESVPGGGSAEGFGEGDGYGEVEFGGGSGDVGDVGVERGGGVGDAVDLDGDGCPNCRSLHYVCKLRRLRSR